MNEQVSDWVDERMYLYSVTSGSKAWKIHQNVLKIFCIVHFSYISHVYFFVPITLPVRARSHHTPSNVQTWSCFIKITDSVVQAVDDLWHWLMDKLMDGWRITWLINQYLITHNTHNYIWSENYAWWEQQNRTETEVYSHVTNLICLIQFT